MRRSSFVVAAVLCALAFVNTATAETQEACTQPEIAVYTFTSVLSGSVFGTQRRQVTRTVTPRVVFAPQSPATQSRVTFERRDTPAYTVVETPAEPYVVRGLFRDRVVQPRRGSLSIEPR